MDIPEEVLIALQGMLEALEQVRPQHVKRLMQISQEVQQSLETRLKSLAPGKYSTQEVRGKLTQARAAVEVLGVEFGNRVGAEVEKIGTLASKIGHDGLIDQIKAWGPQFPGASRLLSKPRSASDALDASLLEYYQTSRETYGMNAISKMKGVLARSALEGKTIVQAWEDLSQELSLPAWKAERIVRTEQAFAASRRQILDTIDAYGDEAENVFAKQLHATFDNRTGDDSIAVHKQARKLLEPFFDGKREYQHPPNRPNDREVMLLVPREEALEAPQGKTKAPAA